MSDAPIRPVVTYEEILENPEYARGVLDSSRKEAADYSAEMLVAGGIILSLLAFGADKLIAKAAGPYGGLISAGIGLIKNIAGKGEEPRR